MSEINVVPYIDVMLVLLIIFMVTAPLLTQGVKIKLPQAPAKIIEEDNQQPLVISVDARGLYFLNHGEAQEVPVEPGALLTRVAALLSVRPETPVMVRGDSDVAYGQVVTLMALLQRAGAPTVGLVTESRADNEDPDR